MSCDAPALDRVFLQIGSLPIYWYGVIIATGAFLALLIGMREADRVGMKKDLVIDLVVYAIPISIICARLYYVIFEWERYAGGPWWDIFAIREGGIAIHGALIGAMLTAIVFTRVKKISFWKLADVLAPSLILGQAIGRWGNFMNQEAHGGPIMNQSVIDMHYNLLPDFIMDQMCIQGIYYFPTFLYESLWNVLVLILLLWLRRRNPIRGVVFLTYIATYSVGRFFIEGMRTDSLYIVGNLRTAQFISILLIVVAVGLILYRWKTVSKRYEDVDKIGPINKKKNTKKKK
ncbi:prolipoprotein diacylglyceryl transferase [Ornithinibacillus bavariensis]|uniref:Phosphatidylglycerol--prolipoprotein diacylglyceryl transferase n=1 Tax=Ornithinibacillus bavariensis TaxID=545502 RepID=A0A919X5Q3_9BACI|nr:prolipoprotein diacylglyceryl transferase [Ornithinibacillus bavariensis]GIO26406.1 prolipoprotein diacylglyceryl transferase [Ornithinibacillus bavariensis]HAM81627.1 prolipoprotein diacylglyceryl transferase [Ornithinibacillus sp.]